MMRLARYLAAAGLGSRRDCDLIIDAGRVHLNGEPVTTPAVDVDPDRDEVMVDGRRVRPAAYRYIVLSKPRGYTCSARDSHAEKLVTELLPRNLGRLFTVGRLDRDSEGLLICTNDGGLAQLLAHPRYAVLRKYRVWVTGSMPGALAHEMREGIRDHGELLRAEQVTVARSGNGKTHVLEISLRQGKKREIRRMCTSFNLRVKRLLRTQYAGIGLGRLQPGQWRELNSAEVELLRAAAAPVRR